ncbi:MAG: hypothetical protein GQ527_03810, partial [Bacteroidales bacterium]|nr:hypothetical protein [Bacteroidales bacterium]
MKPIYSRLILSVLLSFSLLISSAQTYTFSENEGKDGLSLISSNQEKVQLSFAVEEFQMSPIMVEGESMLHLNYGLSFIPGAKGAPDLPSIAKNILIPSGAQVEIILVSSDQEIYENVKISPAAQIPFDTQAEFPPLKGIEYSKNELYPMNSLNIKTTEIRGMQIATIGISPFQYNPISQQLIVHKNIEFEIQISDAKGSYGEDRFRSPFWDQILSDLVVNTDDIPRIDYNKRSSNSKDLGCEYLIVVPDNPDFLMWADTIKRFRNEQGINTKIVTIDEIGGNDIETIDNHFEDVYDNWDPVPSAVLLMADYGNDENTITSMSWTHPYEGSYISDNYYADVTGNNLPDFVFARMTGNNFEEFEIMVNKFTGYESNPPTLESFYDEPITALGWQTERWFQICTESVGGYMSSVLGKTPNRINAIYDGNPLVDPWSTANNTYSVTSYFGPNGLGYIPSSPSELDGWSGGTGGDVVDA